MKEHKGKSGIYQILNTVNHKVYVGKTKCFYKRYYQYVSDVRTQSSDRLNQYLLNAFNKYGFDAFSFSVLEFCSIEQCSEKELEWMTKLDCTNRDKGYNLRMDSSTGMIVHEDTSRKISNNLKQQWADGMRSDHSSKLQVSWEHRDRQAQSKLFSNALTKYSYTVTYADGLTETMFYKGLKEKGFASVISSFHRKQSDTVKYKDMTIERNQQQS